MNGGHGRYQVLHTSDRVAQHSGEPTPAWLAARDQPCLVDETKCRGYLLAASVVIPGEVDTGRWALRGLVLPGQR